jgi:hypothetical protein
MKTRELFLSTILNCLLILLSGCASTKPVHQTTAMTDIPQPEGLVTPTPAIADEGDEMNVSSIIVPAGTSPTIDGTISPGEWDGAAIADFADGSQLFLMQAGDYLYLGIRAIESGMVAGNVFIQRGDKIVILHTSAALGTAVYRQSEAGWHQVQDFTWRCRNTSDSDAARAERAKFLAEEGWLAANSFVGAPNELEYQMKIPDQDFRLTVVYIKATHPYEEIPWPANLDDDLTKPTPGGFPSTFGFKPEKWPLIQVEK